MAAINFVKGEQYYTAEFQINGPVNVHIERAEAGALYFRQRSIDHGSYDLINGANWNNRGDLTIDTAIQGVVYPMWIKIESASEPTLAEMVEGEQSGGGAGTESTMEYLDLTNLSAQAKAYVATCSIEMNVAISYNDNTIVQVAPSALLYSSVGNAIKAYASINLNQPILVAQAGTTTEQTVKDYILSKNITEEELAAIPRITKEQFYSLEA